MSKIFDDMREEVDRRSLPVIELLPELEGKKLHYDYSYGARTPEPGTHIEDFDTGPLRELRAYDGWILFRRGAVKRDYKYTEPKLLLLKVDKLKRTGFARGKILLAIQGSFGSGSARNIPLMEAYAIKHYDMLLDWNGEAPTQVYPDTWVFPFGQYKGETLGWVKKTDPSYLSWLTDNGLTLAIVSDAVSQPPPQEAGPPGTDWSTGLVDWVRRYGRVVPVSAASPDDNVGYVIDMAAFDRAGIDPDELVSGFFTRRDVPYRPTSHLYGPFIAGIDPIEDSTELDVTVSDS